MIVMAFMVAIGAISYWLGYRHGTAHEQKMLGKFYNSMDDDARRAFRRALEVQIQSMQRGSK